MSIEINDQYSAAVMMVSGGYPGDYRKGLPITGLEKKTDSIVFHAGTKKDDSTGAIVTNGGRVLAISSQASSLVEALALSYATASKVHFEDSYYRKDLGQDLKKFIDV